MDSEKIFIWIATWVFPPAPLLHGLVLTEIDCAEKLLVYLCTSPDVRVSVTELVCAEKLLVYLRTSLEFRVNMTDSAEDDVNLRVSTGSLAAINKKCCHILISSGDHLFVGMRPSLDRYEELDTHH